MLGLGGGVFLVPFLNVALGFPLRIASGVGLMTVVATSSVVARGTSGRRQPAAGHGAADRGRGGRILRRPLARRIPEHAAAGDVRVVTPLIAAIMLSRLERRNVILDTSIDPGRLGGRYYEEESGQEVVYRVAALACRARRLAGRRQHLRAAGHRRRHPAGPGAQRVVRRAAARGGRDQRDHDRHHRRGVRAALLRPRRHRPAAGRGGRARHVLRIARRPVVRRARASQVAQDPDGGRPARSCR